jgi:uncharacterized protein YbaR (Trm112 family)
MPVILVCPCCASTVDAESGPDQQELICDVCGQTWSMVINADRLEKHALT